jgi:cation diffusion facilitator family transporter
MATNRPEPLAPALRHSAASLRAARSGGRRRSIVVALGANLVEAAAKLAAGLVTGSSALLAEAVHSTADSINEVLLGISLRHARRPPDAEHPFGHGGVRFLWAFLAAICSFLVGGCVSIGLALRELAGGGGIERPLAGWVVLAVAAAADGTSLSQSTRQARREAALWELPTLRYLRETSDPTLRAVVVEDAAALVGVALAAAALLIHELGGPAAADGVASLLIGLLLATTAIVLAHPLADLLIGRSIAPGRLARARSIIAGADGIDDVLAVYAVHAGPEEAILAAKVHPRPGLTGDQLAGLLDDLDGRLRSELPEIAEVFIDVTSHRSGTARVPPAVHRPPRGEEL